MCTCNRSSCMWACQCDWWFGATPPVDTHMPPHITVTVAEHATPELFASVQLHSTSPDTLPAVVRLGPDLDGPEAATPRAGWCPPSDELALEP